VGAHIRVTPSKGHVGNVREYDGPGTSEDLMATMIGCDGETRNREDTGAGLELTVSQVVAGAHCEAPHPKNRKASGLRVTIKLPSGSHVALPASDTKRHVANRSFS
jgi:hypothetical protein